MSVETLTYIVISGIIALILALFQYLHKTKRNRLQLLFTFLRFLTYFCVLLLIMNPKLDKISFQNQKPSLVVAIDNSSSVEHLGYGDKVKDFVNAIKRNEALNDKFGIDYYTFSDKLNASDSLDFKTRRTDVSKVFKELQQVYKNSIAPVLLITDGNQTYGTDYEFTSKNFKNPVFSVILGDTIT